MSERDHDGREDGHVGGDGHGGHSEDGNVHSRDGNGHGGDTDLYRLVPDGRRLIGDAFLRGETELDDETVEPFLEPLSHDGDVDLATLSSEVRRVVREYDAYEPAVDGELAPTVHRTLDVSRRVAAEPGLWHWLAVVRFPEFVRHRWQYSSEAAMREKFFGAGSDLYSNALHRLWWIAELTHDGDDYSRTLGVFENQTVVNKVFDRWFARYEPGVQVLCEELEGHPSSTVEEVTNRFNHALTNVQLEGMDREDVRRVVRESIAEVEGVPLSQFDGSSNSERS